MATQEQLKKITETRIQSFINLMQAEDWFWAVKTTMKDSDNLIK